MYIKINGILHKITTWGLVYVKQNGMWDNF
jgi:hypothetical protein